MIWININEIGDNENFVYLPESIGKDIPQKVTLKFGLRQVNVQIRFKEECKNYENNSYDNPLSIEISKSVIDKLLIVKSMIYQMSYQEGILNIGPVIGLLLGEQFFYYNNRNMMGFTRGMEIYPETGGLYIGFKDISIDWEEMNIHGLYFDYKSQSWKYGTFPFPSAVFRRAFNTDPKVVENLKKLTGNKVFNSCRLDKWEMHNKLKNFEEFNKYLPDTQKLKSVEIFKVFSDKYVKTILKPAALSRGRGLCFLEKANNFFTIRDYREADTPRFHVIEEDKIEYFLLLNNFINKNYIIQQQINLATINGAPFDIRVVMGKNEDNSYECRGIECRVAGSKNIITNISRGGQALSINNAIKLAFGPLIDSNKVKNEIIEIGKSFCNIMDKTDEHYGEFGLDFCIDGNGNYWFIEANVRAVFRGFKKMNYDNYLHIRHMPLLYAVHLAGFERRQNK